MYPTSVLSVADTLAFIKDLTFGRRIDASIMFNKVDLPHPLGPMIATISRWLI
jgi:hypothetical protein